MGIMSGSRQRHATRETEAAQKFWDDGSLAYVHRETSMVKAHGETLTLVLDGILAIGWKLHSVAANTTSRADLEQVTFVFVRP